ncbi:MAG TPA: tRNA threonylcarbamoyladenosine biosynthesis protein TsaB, partial [Tetragenococcus sp.]|nr:tRNA threonylcarbamoyladenosine biosynthesis protein TsaB [Tetragenococcus sp.]
MKVLAMDTSNQTMTVAVMEDDQILGQIQTMANKTHSKSLMPAIDLLMKNIGVQPKELDRIVVAQGPG